MQIETIENSKPILWIKTDEGSGSDTDLVKFMQGLDALFKENGYDFTLLHTPKGFNLSTMSHEELLSLLDPETLDALGYVKKEILYTLLMSVGDPIEIKDGAEEFVFANKDNFKVRWLEKENKRYIGIQMPEKGEEK